MTTAPPAPASSIQDELDQYRPELVGYCYRMLASPFDAEDAVQETMLRAWRAAEGFERRSSVRTWLYRIATNVCMDLAAGRARRAMPMDLGPAGEPRPELLATPEVPWIEPAPDVDVAVVSVDAVDPERAALARESVRIAYLTATQRLPARQRAVLLLRDVLGWSAAEVAELLETSEASVNSALQRARATLDEAPASRERLSASLPGADAASRAQVDAFVAAFERYDVAELERMLRDDVVQSMPPYDLWLAGRADVLAWWFGPGIACAGSRMVPAGTANGLPAFAQYKPDGDGGFAAWAIVLVDLDANGLARETTFFLEVERLFPRFGLPLLLEPHP